MFGFFKSRREKAERSAQLQQLGEEMGEALRTQLDLFLAMNVIPKREAFLEVLTGQLATVDERMNDMIKAGELKFGEVDREEAAAIEVRIMLENWNERADERLASAHSFLSEQLEAADEWGVGDEYRQTIQDALGDQYLILVTDGMGALNRHMGRETAD